MVSLRLRNISLGRKLLIAFALFILPIMFLLYAIFSERLVDRNFATAERTGIRYFSAIFDVERKLIRSDANVSDVNLASAVADAEATYGQNFGTAGAAADLEEALRMTATDPGHAAARAALAALVTQIADASNLTLDPQLATYYIMDAAVFKGLPIVDGLYGTAVMAQGLSGKTVLTPNEQADFLVQEGGVALQFRYLQQDLKTAFAADPEARRTLGEFEHGVLVSVPSSLGALRSSTLTKPAEATDMMTVTAPALDASSDFVQADLAQLTRLIDVRIAKIDRQLATDFFVALILFALAVIFTGLAVMRGAMLPLMDVVRIIRRMAGGDFSVAFPVSDRSDEIGDLIRAADHFKARAAAAAQAQSAVDNSTSGMMFADNDLRIVFFNASMRQILTMAESDIRRDIPTFAVEALLGSSIDIFEKNPEQRQEVLARLTGVLRTEITLGGRRFNLVFCAARNERNERVGTVVEWSDVTQEIKVQNEVSALVSSALDGDFSRRIDLAGKDGFTLQIAERMNDLCATTARAMGDVGSVISAIADGDLSRRVTADYAGLFEQLKLDTNATAEKLAETVGEILSASDTINTAASEISAGSSDLSIRTEQQASSLEETSASMEQLTATVKQNAQNAQQANQLAAGARTVAEQGGSVAGQAVDAMARIEHSAQKISDIIGVIDEIAFQTNLLALNAAVEAARAGDAGKGFAVVATEVRTLAQRSAQASREIKALIVASGNQVKDGVKLVNDAGKALSEIVVSVKRVADIVSEIASASNEQTIGIDQISTAVMQMDEMTQRNSALVEESAAAARSLKEQADDLNTLMSFFKIRDEAVTRSRNDRKSPVPPRPAPALRRLSAGAPDSDNEWQEF